MKKKCAICNNEFKVYKSTYDDKTYCSSECRRRATYVMVRCVECDTIYSIARSRYEGGFLRHKFCSDKCYHMDKRRKKERSIMSKTYSCANCGVQFTSYRHGKVFHFCSQECSKEYMKGEKSYSYKGGETIGTNGYLYIRQEKKYVLKHRLIYENYIGRKLKADEDVHHIDGDKLNNDISNLFLMSKGEHARHHNRQRKENTKPCV